MPRTFTSIAASTLISAGSLLAGPTLADNMDKEGWRTSRHLLTVAGQVSAGSENINYTGKLELLSAFKAASREKAKQSKRIIILSTRLVDLAAKGVSTQKDYFSLESGGSKVLAVPANLCAPGAACALTLPRAIASFVLAHWTLRASCESTSSCRSPTMRRSTLPGK